jgi:hypothetical protein
MPHLIAQLQLNIAFNCANSDMLPQLPCSPYVSLCDFFLFGDLKRKFNGEEFDTTEGIQARVEELLGHLTPETMQ